MKVLIASMVLALTLTGSVATTAKVNAVKSNIYSALMIVRDTDKKSDLVTLEDFNGFQWQFYGVEDWEINDYCAVTMYDNCTPKIFDDIILNVHYERIPVEK